jgi:hypothetical protein
LVSPELAMVAAEYCKNFKNFDELVPSLKPYYSDFERNYDPVRIIYLFVSLAVNVLILGPYFDLVEVSLLDCVYFCRPIFRLVLLRWEDNEGSGAL